METQKPIYKYTHLNHKIIETYKSEKMAKTAYLSKTEFLEIYNQVKDLIDSGNFLRIEWEFLKSKNVNKTKVAVFLRFCEHIKCCIKEGRKYLFMCEDEDDLESYLLKGWNHFVGKK